MPLIMLNSKYIRLSNSPSSSLEKTLDKLMAPVAQCSKGKNLEVTVALCCLPIDLQSLISFSSAASYLSHICLSVKNPYGKSSDKYCIVLLLTFSILSVWAANMKAYRRGEMIQWNRAGNLSQSLWLHIFTALWDTVFRRTLFAWSWRKAASMQ